MTNEAEKDYTPEEAFKEAQKRFGPHAIVEFLGGIDIKDKFEYLIYPEVGIVGRVLIGKSFRDAFSKDAEQVENSKNSE